MQLNTGARRTSCLIAVLAIVAGLLALAPPSRAASPTTAAAPGAADTATASLARVAGWTAGPVARGTGYHDREGSRRVREVQRRLARLGFAPGPVDGRFGPRTEHATRRFQATFGLRADAIVGPVTLRALRAESPRRRAAARWSAGPVTLNTGYASPQGSQRVREAQWDLRRLGYGTGPVDGRFGPLTAAAVRAFRADRGLPARSSVGPSVLQALRALVPPAASATKRVPSADAGPPSGAAEPPPRTARRPATPTTTMPPVPAPPPVALVIVALIALGLTTTAVTYVRTRRRVRTLGRALVSHPAQRTAQQEGPR